MQQSKRPLAVNPSTRGFDQQVRDGLGFKTTFEVFTRVIRDKFGHELEFPSAFRQSRRDGKPRGIVKIKYGGPS